MHWGAMVSLHLLRSLLKSVESLERDASFVVGLAVDR